LRELQRNLDSVRDRIRDACRRSGRSPDEVRLVAVTKSVGPELARALLEAGVEDLGENRVDELERKHAALGSLNAGSAPGQDGPRPLWHFIGHLQRNKARRAMALADSIHSVDSLRLAASLARLSTELDRRPPVYLEVHLSGEASKHGFAADELDRALPRVVETGLPVAGLMTMAPRPGPAAAREPALDGARRAFARLRELAASLPGDVFVDGAPRLSMGMSGDFEVAIEEGAHLVRVGSALFEGLPEAERGGGR